MIKKFLDLGYQPLANKYLKSYKKLSIKKKNFTDSPLVLTPKPNSFLYLIKFLIR